MSDPQGVRLVQDAPALPKPVRAPKPPISQEALVELQRKGYLEWKREQGHPDVPDDNDHSMQAELQRERIIVGDEWTKQAEKDFVKAWKEQEKAELAEQAAAGTDRAAGADADRAVGADVGASVLTWWDDPERGAILEVSSGATVEDLADAVREMLDEGHVEPAAAVVISGAAPPPPGQVLTWADVDAALQAEVAPPEEGGALDVLAARSAAGEEPTGEELTAARLEMDRLVGSGGTAHRAEAAAAAAAQEVEGSSDDEEADEDGLELLDINDVFRPRAKKERRRRKEARRAEGLAWARRDGGWDEVEEQAARDEEAEAERDAADSAQQKRFAYNRPLAEFVRPGDVGFVPKRHLRPKGKEKKKEYEARVKALKADAALQPARARRAALALEQDQEAWEKKMRAREAELARLRDVRRDYWTGEEVTARGKIRAIDLKAARPPPWQVKKRPPAELLPEQNPLKEGVEGFTSRYGETVATEKNVWEFETHMAENETAQRIEDEFQDDRYYDPDDNLMPTMPIVDDLTRTPFGGVFDAEQNSDETGEERGKRIAANLRHAEYDAWLEARANEANYEALLEELEESGSDIHRGGWGGMARATTRGWGTGAGRGTETRSGGDQELEPGMDLGASEVLGEVPEDGDVDGGVSADEADSDDGASGGEGASEDEG